MYRKIIPDIVTATEILTIKHTGRASEAAKLMAKKNIAAIIVVDENGKIKPAWKTTLTFGQQF